MVEMKRHMKFVPHSVSGAKNPYLRVDEHVKEAVEMAESIVKMCTTQFSDSSLQTLSALLERFCFLVTPSDGDATTKAGRNTGGAHGASYDSSLAAVAANSILSRFMMDTRQPNENTSLAFILANALAQILGASNTASQFQSIQIQAAIVLTQLSAMEPPPPPNLSFDQDQFSPYGHPPQELASSLELAPSSWCHVLVHSQALSALIQKVTMPSSMASITPHDVNICEKCVWAIGNLAGDSEMAREALLEAQTLTQMIRCISWGIASIQSCTPDVQGSLINLLRNSLRTMVNFARVGMVCLADLVEVNNAQMSNGEQQCNLMTSGDLSSLLLLPPSVSNETKLNTDLNNASCHDVVTETFWLLAFLTDKDSITIEFICQENTPLIPAILAAFTLGTDAASQLFDTGDLAAKEQLSEISLCLIPCCRVLRNIALEGGQYISSIFPPEIFLKLKQQTLAHPTETCLAKLISLGTLGAGQEASSISSKAGEAAGACLVYAGLPLPHPSTLACGTLIPALRRSLVCELSTFEVKREAVWALWNAVNTRLDELDELTTFTSRAEVDAFQSVVLTHIVGDSEMEMFESLIGILATMDMDSMEAALRLIETIIQKSGSRSRYTVLFEHAGFRDALWRICDNDSDESLVAELAARILDDHYNGEEDNEDILAPSSDGEIFQFQAPSTTGGFDFSASNSGGFTEEQRPLAGRGRGRGSVIPAWMERSQQT